MVIKVGGTMRTSARSLIFLYNIKYESNCNGNPTKEKTDEKDLVNVMVNDRQ